jgi:hypothetical protein
VTKEREVPTKSPALQTNVYGTVTRVDDETPGGNIIVWVTASTWQSEPKAIEFPTQGEFAKTMHDMMEAKLAERALGLEVGEEVTISYHLMSKGKSPWRRGTGLNNP